MNKAQPKPRNGSGAASVAASVRVLNGDLPQGVIECIFTARRFATNQAFDDYRALARQLGRLPTDDELRDSGLVSTKLGWRWPTWPVSKRGNSSPRR